MITFIVRDLPAGHGRVIAPRRGTLGSAGFDLFFPEDVVLPAKVKLVVDLRLQVLLPDGCYGQMALRSSAAAQHSILLLGGVIGNSTQSASKLRIQNYVHSLSDRDYTGSISAILFNLGDTDVLLPAGQSFVQLIPVMYVESRAGDHQEPVAREERGALGFGSTSNE
jgi:dUTP pyrophosphatase